MEKSWKNIHIFVFFPMRDKKMGEPSPEACAPDGEAPPNTRNRRLYSRSAPAFSFSSPSWPASSAGASLLTRASSTR